jgi:hypothetical protein
VGDSDGQVLIVLDKDKAGKVTRQRDIEVRFVPMVKGR